MLDPRVRIALTEYQRQQRSLESTAMLLAQVRRETGCLELHSSPNAEPTERALAIRFAELVAADASAGRASGPTSG